MLESIVDEYPSAMIDLRPYMWEHPFTVSINDSIDKCLHFFVGHQLRHLPVVDLENGSVVGLITRKDLFRFVGL